MHERYIRKQDIMKAAAINKHENLPTCFLKENQIMESDSYGRWILVFSRSSLMNIFMTILWMFQYLQLPCLEYWKDIFKRNLMPLTLPLTAALPAERQRKSLKISIHFHFQFYLILFHWIKPYHFIRPFLAFCLNKAMNSKMLLIIMNTELG